MGRILNPSGWHVEGMSASVPYQFPQFSIVSVYHDSDFTFLTSVQAMKDKGLVSIEPNTAEMAKYKDKPNEFLKLQAIKGLKALLKKCNEDLTNEAQAEHDVKMKSGTEADKKQINPKRFEDKVKQVEKWLSEVESDKWTPSVYFKNEVKRQDEPWDYKNAGAA